MEYLPSIIHWECEIDQLFNKLHDLAKEEIKKQKLKIYC